MWSLPHSPVIAVVVTVIGRVKAYSTMLPQVIPSCWGRGSKIVGTLEGGYDVHMYPYIGYHEYRVLVT